MSDRDPTPVEELCFEAGIKFGTLYHQFAGTPVSPTSADSLAAAIEEAIENQPHCRSVTVEVRAEELEAAVADGTAEYVELTGRFLEVEIVAADDEAGLEVVTRMAMDNGYPLMTVETVRASPEASDSRSNE